MTWRIEGTTDERGRPAIAIDIEGEVPVTCQRCLSDFALPGRASTVAVLAQKREGGRRARCEQRPTKSLVADHPLDAVELVEDELLLTLPYAPMHDSDCERRAAALEAAHYTKREEHAHGRPTEQEVAVEARHASRARSPAAPPLAVEPVTGETHLRHHISPTGYYRGKKVVKTKADE